MTEQTPLHFKGKSAVEHVAEAQAQGKVASVEIHGTEIPGHISAGADAARETALFFLLLAIFFQNFAPFILLGLAWTIWKCGRSAWLGWSRLERLHRVVAEEKWEIDHHRQQERDELRELYAAKGFEGKLLEDVLDVLMADGDRLLRVMVEEELGLSLESQEHPLKQGLGAAFGVVAAMALSLIPFALFSTTGLVGGALLSIGFGAAVSAHYQRNQLIPAIFWNIGIALLSAGSAFFLRGTLRG